MVMPADADRAAHHRLIETGDSGSPVCFVYRDRLVAAWSVANSDGSGVWLAGVRDWADAVVARTGHTLTELQHLKRETLRTWQSHWERHSLASTLVHPL